MLKFDEAKHEYSVDGVIYDGVTSIIKAAGFMPDYAPADAEWYMTRGSAIHSATEYYDKGTLDESTIDPRIAGYLESWKKLKTEYSPEEIEIRLCDDIYRVAGTLDRIDCDIKSGAYAPWHLLQASIYWQLKKVNKLDPCLMKGIYLQEDGSFPKIKTYTVQELMQGVKIFYSALAVVRWKKENKLLDNKNTQKEMGII